MFPLYVICDADACARAGWAPADFAIACIEGGARLLQVRAKTLASGEFLQLVSAIVQAAAPHGAQVIVNDRVDVARFAGADGVHVGQEDLPPAVAREQLGDAAIVGLSTHSTAQIAAAVREPVSYIAVGPIFGTSTKDTGYTAVGLDLVASARRHASAEIAIVAIGGITLDRAADVIRAGASAVAVISDLLTGDPAARVRAYLERLAAAAKV
jgi:thiamine-phosphate pyrophosphorylase